MVRYKTIIKSKRIIGNFPRRIKLFRRIKWKQFISRNKYRIYRYKFKNFFIRSFSKKRYRFVRMKKYYKQSILQKIRLQQIYNNAYHFKQTKKKLRTTKTLGYVDLLTNIMGRNLFYLDILLWNTYFFVSTYEARYNIEVGHVLVNGKKVKSTYFLKVGDVITFKNRIVNFRKNFKKYKIFSKFHSYIEIDYYIPSIVIVKNFIDFNIDDYTLIFSRPFRIIYINNIMR